MYSIYQKDLSNTYETTSSEVNRTIKRAQSSADVRLVASKIRRTGLV